MAGAQLPKFPEQLSADCGKAPSAGMPCLQASPHPGMFGKLADSLCHGRGADRPSSCCLVGGGMAAAINQQHCPAPSYPPCLHLSPCAGSWDHRVLWVGKDLKTHPAPRPAVSGDTFHEAAPRPAQPGLARFGVFRPFLGCRPWWHTWTPGQARSGWLSFCRKAHKHQMLHAGETKSAFL